MNRRVKRARCCSVAARLFVTLVFVPVLSACFATTDRLAVFKNGVLSKNDVSALIGHYHILESNGTFGSLSFAPRKEPWLHRETSRQLGSQPNSPQRPMRLAAANLTLKSESASIQIQGVAVFSRIPGTDLILIGVPGETKKIGMTKMLPFDQVEGGNDKSIFFVMKHSGEALTLRIFSDEDKGLKRSFNNLEAPIPTDGLLSYLRTNAQSMLGKPNLPVLVRSTPGQQTYVEQRIDKVLAVAEEKEQQRKQAKKAKKESQAKKAQTTGKQKKQAAPSGTQKRSSQAPRIASIDGFYAAGPDGVIEIKVRKKHPNGAYEFRGYAMRRDWVSGRLRRGDFAARGYWYPDSQQFYSQGWFQDGRSNCGDWSEANWTFPFKFKKERINGRTIAAWYPSVLSLSVPKGRKKKSICINRKIDPNNCAVLRCNEKSDPNKSSNIYLVRSKADASWISKHRFGK